jgi:hypothetical protein
MSPELEKVYPVLLKFAEHYAAEYGEKWVPSSEHIALALQLLKNPLPGFDAYAPEDLIGRIEVFFKCKEPWLISSRHNFSVFARLVHRWVGTRPAFKHRVEKRRVVKCDCGEEFWQGQLCPKCFPKCDKCGQVHAKEIACEEAAKLDAIARRIVSGSSIRTGSAKRLGELL